MKGFQFLLGIIMISIMPFCKKSTQTSATPEVQSLSMQRTECSICTDYAEWSNSVDNYGNYLDSLVNHLDTSQVKMFLQLIESGRYRTAALQYNIPQEAIQGIIDRYAILKDMMAAIIKKASGNNQGNLSTATFTQCLKSCYLPKEAYFVDPWDNNCRDQLNQCYSDASDRLWDNIIDKCLTGTTALTIGGGGGIGLAYGLGCWGYYEWRYFRERKACRGAYDNCMAS